MTRVIAGVVRLDGAPASREDSSAMAALAARRWPHTPATCREGPASLACAARAPAGGPAPRLRPVVHLPTGCVCVADARLDNGVDLLQRFGRVSPTAEPSPSEVILAAYLTRGERCAEELAGEFAFAVWDPRSRTLLLGRDRLGERPLYVHHAPGRLLAFASDPLALLALEDVPFRVDDGRVADFLVDHALEGIDATSTFYDGVTRLPPAHTLAVSAHGAAPRRYWRLTAGPTLRLPSNEAYAEAFLHVFTQAVRSRLHGGGSVGSMVSGGVDSGAASAVAGELLDLSGSGPLPTFSAVGPDAETCAETRAIRASLRADPRLRGHTVCHGDLTSILPRLEELTWGSDEPFDGHQIMLRAVNLVAAEQGVRSLFNGGGADVVLGWGTRVAHLIRRGRLHAALREARELDRFHSGNHPAVHQLARGLRAAFVPEGVRRAYHRVREPEVVARAIRSCLIAPGLAHRVALADRFRRYRATRAPSDLAATEGANNGRYMTSPDYAVGVEIYHRLAANVGVEPLDPFQDLRVVDFGTSLPGEQLLHDGWPKVILRRAMAGRLPDEVRWRRGSGSLGLSFTRALVRHLGPRLRERLEGSVELLRPYVRLTEARRGWNSDVEAMDDTGLGRVFDLAVLAAWLERHRTRPVPPHGVRAISRDEAMHG